MNDASVVRTFRGDRQSVVEAEAASDAEQMAREGYVVTSRVWSTGHDGILERLFTVGPARTEALRASSSLTVTYGRQTWTPDDQPA